MIQVPCYDCRLARTCAGRRAMHRESILAWAHDLPMPACASFEHRWWRGIEGVVDHSPRPSVHGTGRR